MNGNNGYKRLTDMGALRVFISYSHKDREPKQELETFLFQLKESKDIEVWQDGELLASDEFRLEIREALSSADIVLLLISQDFIVSPFIRTEELSLAMERHAKGEARVVPIILRRCNWKNEPYGVLVALPQDGKPISESTNKDATYTEIAMQLDRLVKRLAKQKDETAAKPS
jgi:hypothetical protein